MPSPVGPGPVEGNPGGDRFRQLLPAMLGVASGLSLPEMLLHVTETAREVARARYCALGVISDDGYLSEFVTSGMAPEVVEMIGDRPRGKGVLGLLIVEPHPIRIAKLGAHPQSSGFPPNHPRMESFLGVPIRIGDDVFGNLYLCDKVGEPEFTQEDEDLIVALAAVVAIAVDNARLHRRLQDLAVLQDRERIARDLHDKVIQRLFAAGMALQASSRHAGEATERILDSVEELDSIISEIRGTIFDLGARPSSRPTLAVAMLNLTDEMTIPSGIVGTVAFHGDVDDLDPALGDELLAVAREALANVAKHAQARSVRVELVVGDDVRLVVEDDGEGFPGRPRAGHGLGNLTARAFARHGTCTITPGTGGGTRVDWCIPRV